MNHPDTLVSRKNETERSEAGEGAVSDFRLGYRPDLDGLRAIAILVVLLRHAPGWPGGILKGGWLGVDIFFVLSGFLITTLLLEERRTTGTISLKQFYIRRILRLVPVLVLVVVLWCSYAWAAFPEDEARLTCWQAVVTLAYVTNWVQAFCLMPMDQLAPTWSLAIEEQFYLVWPVTLVVALRFGAGTKVLLGILTAGTLLSALTRIVLFAPDYCSIARLYNGSDTRADSLLIGCTVGVLAVSGYLPAITRHRRALGTAALVAGGILTWIALTLNEGRPPLYFGLFTVIALASATILVWILGRPESRVTRLLATSPMVWVGRRSYGIYLWHAPITVAIASPLTVMIAGQQPPRALVLSLYLGCTTLAAFLSYRYLERPVLEIKRRFARVGSGSKV